MYSRAKADHAVAFISNLKHTLGQWHGVPFDLLDWQKQIVQDVFGTLRPNGYRQYNTAYVEIPKKNGKSELAAAIALLLLAGDDEWGAQVYGCASDRGQASIVFDVAVDMVDQCPALRKRIKPVLSIKRLVYLPTNSYYQVCSAEAYTKHGLNVHGVIFDELHAQPNRELYDVMTKGSGDTRTQPLYFLITTAGDDPDRVSVGWEVHEKARKIKQRIIDDPTFYPVIYGARDDDDWTDEEAWFRSNPSLGQIIPIEKVRDHFNAAKQDPSEERLFRQLRLNQWVRTKTTKWIPLEKWDATAGLVVPEKLKGRICYGGMDLSSTLDITANCLVFPPVPEDPNWYALWDFWIPEENMKVRVKRDGVPYDKWVKEGLIHTTPGDVIDYAFIRKTLNDLRLVYDIRELGFDPWNALQLSLGLADDGFNMVEIRQGFKTLSPAMKDLERLVLGNLLRHGGNPVARWMFGNIEVKTDENQNIRPIKTKSAEKIDGIVALVMALSRAMLQRGEAVLFFTVC